MADTAELDFYEQRAPGRNEQQTVDRQPTRLDGDCAAGTVVGTSSTVDEKVRIKGSTRVRARIKGTGTNPDVLLKIVGCLSDGTAASTDIVSQAVTASATEYSLDYTPWGDKDVIVSVVNQDASDTYTISYVEVSIL